MANVVERGVREPEEEIPQEQEETARPSTSEEVAASIEKIRDKKILEQFEREAEDAREELAKKFGVSPERLEKMRKGFFLTPQEQTRYREKYIEKHPKSQDERIAELHDLRADVQNELKGPKKSWWQRIFG